MVLHCIVSGGVVFDLETDPDQATLVSESTLAPCLTTRTKLFSEAENRPYIPDEGFCFQGFPMFEVLQGSMPESLAPHIECLANHNETNKQVLFGNAFHVAVISELYFFVLANVCRRDEVVGSPLRDHALTDSTGASASARPPPSKKPRHTD